MWPTVAASAGSTAWKWLKSAPVGRRVSRLSTAGISASYSSRKCVSPKPS